jgi:hypothetical protein
MKRLHLISATCALLAQFFVSASFAQDASGDLVHVAGYLAPNAILVFRDQPRTAYFVEPGQVVKGVKIKTVNGAAVIAEAGGKPFSVQPSAQPLPVGCMALQDYLMNVVKKIDKQAPTITESTVVTIGPNGAPVNDTSSLSYFVRSQPYGLLPAGVDSMTFYASYGYPRDKVQARITQLQLSKPAF